MLAWTKQNTMQRAMRTVLEWPQSHVTSKTINMKTNKYEPQQKCRLGTVSKKILGGLHRFYGYPTSPSASINYETGSMTGILRQLKWESLKKRRKDNRLILLYKGLKGKASVPTDDRITKTRRCRNQYSIYLFKFYGKHTYMHKRYKCI